MITEKIINQSNLRMGLEQNLPFESPENKIP